ncbi:DUF5132 domain-containing protein [Paenibacillus filicis]|uniref:DUF5132 domain-containing protein n=1 Tax=Paenibacillus gyeongsangnamensis TaxID=3388067 RepID=A0ABT4QFI5_9BACL|nr:DUF5132 domain-containing protein [Paenibacillus filicis]MCZ8515643.1 DUF5132 domain-containing protein [Paenibacillus filicis]
MLEKNAERLLVGAVLALAASTLLPVARRTLIPLAETGLQTLSGLTERVKAGIEIARNEVEDVVAEAQFERMRKRLDKEIEMAAMESDC